MEDYIFHTLRRKGLDITYYQYSSRINEKLFKNPHGIHGVLHTKRVLLLNLLLAEQMGLREADTTLLATAAVYHDIGRMHDGVCKIHGVLGFRKILKLGLISDFTDEDAKILKFIIENHCINDRQALNQFVQYNIRQEKRALSLFRIFKDADGLDRVRLGDLDATYLRHDISKDFIPIAESLCQLGQNLELVLFD